LDEDCQFCETFQTNYKLGQKFVLDAQSSISRIYLDVHNYQGDRSVPPSNFDAKISINTMNDPENPNAGLNEIYSTILSNLPIGSKNYVNIKLNPPLNLSPGTYFLIVEAIESSSWSATDPNQALSVSKPTSFSKYPYQLYFMYKDQPLLWQAPGNFNMYFRLLGNN
jgi:hypothetical protein